MSSAASNDSIIYHCHLRAQGEEGLNHSQVIPRWQKRSPQYSESLVLYVYVATLRQEDGK